MRAGIAGAAARAMRFVSGALLVVLAACGSGQQKGDLQVMAYGPQGPVDKAEPVEIKFDQPVVDESLVGTPVDPQAITITPAVAWKGFWQDRQTLSIEPADTLAPSTRYTVTLAGELGRRTKGFGMSFVHRPLTVDGVWGVDAMALAPDGELPLSFNQPVVASEVAAHCALVAATGEKIALAAATSSEPTANVSLTPTQKLASGAAYTVTCSELAGAGGNARLDKPYTLAVRARPTLTVTQVTPTGTDIGADEVGITIAFSTPVSLDAARKAITAKPAIRGIDQGYLSGDGKEYRVTADLEVTTAYKLEVKGLVDSYGQQLAAPATHTFRTGDAAPRLSMERGIFALEASAKGYPLWSRNVGTIDLECARIPRDRLVQVLTTDMNYDPWGGNDDDKPIEWKKLKATAKQQKLRSTAKNKWVLHDLELGASCAGTPGARGVFLAEVSSAEVVPDPQRMWMTPRRNRVLANVTDLGVLIKAGTASGVVWVTSLATGAPVAGAKVSVYQPNGKQVHTGTSDAEGLVRIPGTAQLKQQKAGSVTEEEDYEDWDSYRSQRLIAIVEKDADLAIVDGNWSNGIQTWNFGVPEDRRGGAIKLRGFIQSDRGLYRPGETVHFKGITREIAQGAPPRVPTGKQRVAIEVQDSRGQVALTTTAKLSTFGGFAFDMPLGTEAVLGDYYVAATIGDQVFREKFSVEEFRPATFELGLTAGQKSPRPGARLTFNLDAKYLFGAPVAAGKVEWSLRKRNHPVRFTGFEQYSFSANPYAYWWYDESDDYGSFIADGSGQTSARGALAIAARDSATTFDGPVDYILTASVIDASDQTMSKSALVTAHKTSLYLGVHANEYVQAVGMPFGVNLVALAPDGARTQATAKLTFTKIDRTCTWDSVGARAYQRCDTKDKVTLERDVTIATAGSHTERIYPTEPGEYVVRIATKDARGNAVVAASNIWVIGKGDAFWSGDEGARMTLIASKPSYQVGETARLVAQANMKNPTALITIERDGVISAQVKRLASATEGVELPIVDAWAPNVFASVALVTGRGGDGDKHRPQFKMGLVKLEVATEHKQLDVAVALDAATVRPGEKVSGTITVTHRGAPVKAEVSLSAADEGVLQLISYVTPNPMKTFYAAYGLGVDSGTNWNRIARLADPKAGDPDEGGDGGSSDAAQRVRSKFVASAYWAPMLVTDDSGKVAFTFTAPDNLSAFRLMAVAADIGDRFGAGEQRLTVNKPLMAAPVLPRFMRPGDAAQVGVIVHNRTDQPGTATVIAKANGARLSATRHTVQVAANSEARVRFTAVASDNAAATFEFSVALNDQTDAVRTTLPIGRPRIYDNRLLVEQKLAAKETWTGAIGSSPDVLQRESYLSITVDKSGVGELAPSLRALVEYPYGCLEQTMSRFIPLVAARDLAATLDDPSLKGTQASRFIRAGTAKVIRHQQADGLFSLWPQSDTHAHLAAYALWGLTVAEKAGEKVPADVFDRGIAALHTWANGKGTLKPDGEGATMAMAAYVMALRQKPDASLNARLFALRTGLPKWGQAFLLRALHLGKADPAQVREMEATITQNLEVKNGKAIVRESIPGEEYEMYMTSDVRATAMTLAALLEVSPASPLIDPLVAGLKSQRTKVGTWVSTQENLWSLVALAEYGRRQSAGTTTATVTVGGKQVLKQKLTGAQVKSVKVPLGTYPSDAISVTTDNGGSIAVRVVESRVDQGTAQANGFTIARRYLDATTGLPKTAFAAGDVITVELTVTAAQHRRWVAMVDPIPAGFELMNAKLASGSDATTHTGWGPWVHSEMRDDRMQWFADDMRASTYTVTYQARATIAGTFLVLPATIEAMYFPDVRGRTASTSVTIAK